MVYLEVGDVSLAQDQPPPCPHHDVAGLSLNMDLFKAKISSKAGLGGADVATHSCPMEEEPATWKLACCWAIDTDKARHACAVGRQTGPDRHDQGLPSGTLAMYPKKSAGVFVLP